MCLYQLGQNIIFSNYYIKISTLRILNKRGFIIFMNAYPINQRCPYHYFHLILIFVIYENVDGKEKEGGEKQNQIIDLLDLSNKG